MRQRLVHLPFALLCCTPSLPARPQGAFKQVAVEAEACARELAGILRRRLLAAPDQAAECIQMIAKLGEPTESLQEDFLECQRQRLEGLLAAAGLMLKTLAVDQGLLPAAGALSFLASPLPFHLSQSVVCRAFVARPCQCAHRPACSCLVRCRAGDSGRGPAAAHARHVPGQPRGRRQRQQ